MSQHDYVIANGTGAAVRSDLNGALAAIVTQNSGATAPSTTYAYQWWADTTTGLLKLRNAANNAWITLFQLDGEWSTLAVENGSAAAPSIYFKDSGTDTGIYSPGTDQVAISTGGTGRLFVDSSGRVGLGTSAPQSILHLAGTNPQLILDPGAGNTGPVSINSWRTNTPITFRPGDTEVMRVTSTGLAIGTTTASTLLHLASSDPVIRLQDTDTNAYGQIAVDNSGNVTIQADESNAQASSSIRFNVDGSERVRLDSSGRFLVGTSTSLDSDALVQAYKSSGSAKFLVDSDSLANTDIVNYTARGGAREASLGVYKHSGITNPCAYLTLICENGGAGVLWVDNSNQLRISDNGNNIGTTSGTVVGTQTSDERIKNILGPVEYGLDTLKQIEPVRYSLKSEPETEKLGFIAQQVQPLVPQSVFDTKEHIEGEPEDAPTKLGMEYVALIPVLVNSVKELSAEVDALKAQLS